MAILGGGERLMAAYDRAVKEALAETERWAATRVRARNQDTDRVTGNLIVACYRPAHTHCVAANMTLDAEEQKWKALQAGGIYDRRGYLSEVYRNVLAHEVEKLGYDFSPHASSVSPLGRGFLTRHDRECEQLQSQGFPDMGISAGKAFNKNQVLVERVA